MGQDQKCPRGCGRFVEGRWKAFGATKGYLAGSHTENLLISEELSSIFFDGEVREWLNRPVSKTVSPQGHGGSNPPLSAVVVSIGKVTEWPKVLAWKASVGQPTGGSNPPLSEFLPW